MVSVAAPEPPSWSLDQRPALPAGVRLEGTRLVDDVLGESYPLEGDAARLVGRFGAADLRELAAQEPGSWPFLAKLNRYHLLNLEGSPARRPVQQWHGIKTRTSLAGRGVAAVVGDLVAVVRSLGLVLSNPRLAVLLALTIAACIAFGYPALGVLAAVFVTLGGYALHEFGHAAAARMLGLPAYALADRFGVSVWTRPCSARKARLFACAGPLLPVALGLALASAPFAWTDELRFVCTVPLLVHVVALTPLCHDGRVALFGRARDASLAGPAPAPEPLPAKEVER